MSRYLLASGAGILSQHSVNCLQHSHTIIAGRREFFGKNALVHTGGILVRLYLSLRLPQSAKK